ncbi:MAG: methylenetetrahydrofolate reductase [NAD(P)H] [Bernardetiaceae bacterium]
MKIIEVIKNRSKTLFSFEIIPPLKGQSIQPIFDAMDPLMEFKPAFVDVTYHREEFVYKKHPNGLLERRVTRKRPGTVGICAAIMNRYHVVAVPHIICGGFDRSETEDALIDLHFLGVENVLALRGDSIKNNGAFTPEENGHSFASDLIQQINAMNQGQYLDEELQNSVKTDFCIGVAGYPEKHFEAPNLTSDLEYLKYKVDLGAEYIITQMFFDNEKFFAFERKCREMGIDVPIIPGLKPLATKAQLVGLSRAFHIDFPEALVDEVKRCKDNKQVRQVGIDWCIEQSKELMDRGVPVLHYYTMSRSKATQEIGAALF